MFSTSYEGWQVHYNKKSSWRGCSFKGFASVQGASVFPVCFTKALIVNQFPLAEKTDWVTDFRILDQAENVIVCRSCLLLWGDGVRAAYTSISLQKF